MPKDIADVQARVRFLQDIWQTFSDVREDNWLPLGRRELYPNVPEQVEQNAKKVPQTSPVLEDNISADVQILTQNDAEVEFIAQEDSEDAREDVEKSRLYAEILKRKINHGLEIDSVAATQLVWPYGLSVWRVIATMPDEPELDAEDEEYQRERDRYFKESDQQCFDIDVINPGTWSHWPLREDKFTECCEVKRVDVSRLKRRSDGLRGKDLLEEARSLPGWSDSHSEQHASDGNEVTFTAYEYLDEEEGCWYRVEYITESDNEQAEGMELDRIKLPRKRIKRGSYLVIPSGTANLSENADPHRRYRPRLYSLGVTVEKKNFWETLRAAVVTSAFTDKGIWWQLPTNLDQDARRVLSDIGLEIMGTEGVGAAQMPTVEIPERTNREVLVIPGQLSAWPGLSDLLNSIDSQLAMINEELREYKTNAYQTGRAFVQYAEAPSTTNSLATQQSGLIYGKHTTNINTYGWENFFELVFDIICAWDEDSETKQYVGVTSGNERKAKPGQQVKITPEIAKRRKTIIVKTRVENSQEKLVREQRAQAQYDRGELKWVDLLQELGHDDPLKYSEELAEDAYLIEASQNFAPVQLSRMQVLAKELTGLNMLALGEQAMQLQQAASSASSPAAARANQPPGGRTTDMPRTDRKPGGAPAIGSGVAGQ